MINSKEERQKKLISVSAIIILVISIGCQMIGLFLSMYVSMFYYEMIFGYVLFSSEVLFLFAVLTDNKYKFLFTSSAMIYMIYNCCFLVLRIVFNGSRLFESSRSISSTIDKFLMAVFAVILFVGVIKWCFDKKSFKIIFSVISAVAFISNAIYTSIVSVDTWGYIILGIYHLVLFANFILYLGALFLFYVGYPMKNIFLRKNSYLAKSDIDIEYALEILKNKYDSGKISPEEYTRAKREVLDKMLR